jgi:DHA2 family multidrug resistance protein-like MFS transporter
LLENFWWGSVFLLGVPVMLVLLVTGPLLLPEHRDPQPGRFDLLSAGMSLTAVLLVIYGLKQVAENGLGWLSVLSVVVGLAIGFAFIQRQRSLADPLLDLRLFRVPAFSASLATYTLGIFAAFGTFLFIAQYLQLVVGLSPLQAGLWSVPGAFTFIIGSNLAPILVRRVHPAFLVAGGLVLAAISLGLLTQVGLNSLALVVSANTLMSLGFGFTFTLTIDLVVSAAPSERAGAASALAETGAELGGALGLAILGSLGIAVYRSQVTAALPASISPEAAEAVKETLGGAVAVAEQLSGSLGPALLHAAQEAFVLGLQLTSGIGAVVMIGLAILTVSMLRHIEVDIEQEAQPTSEPDVLAAVGACVQ